MARVTGSILSINYQCIFTVGLGLPEIFSSQMQISKAYIYRGYCSIPFPVCQN
jgi:hypothetical protein